MTPFPVISADVIRTTVGLADLLEPVAEALMAFSRGESGPPAVSLLNLPLGEVHIKSAFLQGHPLLAVKVATSFPGNAAQGLRPFDGVMLALNAQTGQVVAALHDESYLTDLRTAAAGAVAARALANPVVRTVGVLGTGVQARLQVQAVRLVRDFGTVLVWGRSPEKAEQLVHDLATRMPGVRFTVMPDRRSLVEHSDLVITATSSRAPLVEGAWLRPGQHVTAIGGDDVGKVELDAAVLGRANRLIVDSRELNLRLGDVQAALMGGHLRSEDVHGELGEVLAGDLPGRTHERQITVAKLVGLGGQDLAAVEVTLNRLQAATRVEL
ncbi:ornithine cyclodeaminase family protein [Deinococcus oregonensis]|uniref:Ornithine cyclodeaminase family protein n=1 Tax=Deinococcus oregonensis TaxID=1805970 RepID=A0ABV6B6D1_9DEIO